MCVRDRGILVEVERRCSREGLLFVREGIMREEEYTLCMYNNGRCGLSSNEEDRSKQSL